jgi:hypothetical protein
MADDIAAVVGIVLLWALICGVTVNGKHYGLAGCDCRNGVKIDTGASK